MASPRLIYRISARLHAAAAHVYYRLAGGERRPVFFDPARTMPALLEIDRNVDAIREELLALLAERGRIPRYHEIDAKQAEIAPPGGEAWRTYMVQVHWAGERLANRRACPRTAAVLDGIPDVIGGFFSILEPGAEVPPHNGPAFWYLRYHTALVVPERDPPRLRVKDRWYTWKEGESVLFDDSWNHEVENASDGLRAVLVTDVLRPVPWPVSAFGRLLRRLRIPPRETWDDVLERFGLDDSHLRVPDPAARPAGERE